MVSLAATQNIGSKSPLLKLPNELLLEVAVHLEHFQDLNSLLRTSRFFHNLFHTLLYRRVLTASDNVRDGIIRWMLINYRIAPLRHLLHNGLSANHKFKRGNIDLLHMVCESRNDERSVPLARELLAHGAGVDTAGRAGFTPLHEAVSGGHYDLATLLLAHGAGVDTADKTGFTPLHEAVAGGHYDLATLLLAHGAAVDSRINSGNTPLHMVFIYADRADCRLASLLLEHGADVNAIDFNGRTSLHLLSTSFFGSEWDHDLSMAALLLKNGADVTVMAKNGRSPLQEAMDDPSFSEEHRDRLIELLIAHGADNTRQL